MVSRKPIPWAPGYEVDACGVVYSTRGPLKPWVRNQRGYVAVTLRIRGVSSKEYVHRVVARVFHGSPPPGHEVRHIDGNPLNNRASNLAWGTHDENMKDMVSMGRHGSLTKPDRVPRGARHGWRRHPELIPRGERSGTSKLTEADVIAIRNRLATGEAATRIALDYPRVRRETIAGIAIGRSWKHLGGPVVGSLTRSRKGRAA